MPSQRYRRREDLEPLLVFASASFAARAPLGATWHPGDVVWELRGRLDDPQSIRMWTDDDGVVAVGWFVGPGELWIESFGSRPCRGPSRWFPRSSSGPSSP
jgi:hypothetical protein